MADEDFADDAQLQAAIDASTRDSVASKTANASPAQAPQGPPKVQQPKPQALPSRSGPHSILVSPRQKGNPILNSIRAMPWEYSDIPADYVLGTTTCALFLSLKYHRLHPEYIYSRIRQLAGKYNLRIILTMVDITNHEESLKELSKTSVINNVTIILCWSAQEAGRYLELFKTYEHAAPTSIRAHQSTSFADKLVEFITVPRSINKTDAVGLVSNFGSIRTAVNARPEEVALVAGWGEKKVQRWCNTVREPFRIRKAAKQDSPDPRVAARLGVGAPIRLSDGMSTTTTQAENSVGPDAERRPETRVAEDAPLYEPGEDEEAAMLEMESASATRKSPPAPAPTSGKRKAPDDEPSEGVAAALAKLRQQG
ncbi:mating-type switching protein swi10 [Saccharata proteae CBS 121410]|uniref:Mating-type switching protein swi10 n=1 Tax=Saccharata proteae CBS 121410 TaxID=1314787 RepID=A0A6A5YB82_9PEZI|nr:mating-type switching protein swi10 [Saccharata proteae CBS 121410]